jgi:hypothetical protein
MRDHTKLRAFELADEVAILAYIRLLSQVHLASEEQMLAADL